MVYKNLTLSSPEIEAIVEELPSADVVPVVRCRECKFSREPAKLTRIYGKPGTLTCHHGPCNKRNVNENDFCSCGEISTDNSTQK